MLRSARSWTSRRWDVGALVLVAGLAMWVALAAGSGEGRSGPVLWLLAGLVVAFGVGRRFSRRTLVLDRLVAVSVAGAVVLTWPGILRAGGAPTGYANANASLTSLGMIAAIGVAAQVPPGGGTRRWIGLAGALGAATALTGSVAGVASLLLALGLFSICSGSRRPGVPILGGAIVVASVLGVTTAIAMGADPVGLGDRAGMRAALWSEALDLLTEEPLLGIGAGEFAERTRVSSDEDLRWAHQEYLQAGAELGMPGLALVLALGGWLALGVWSRAERRAVSAGLGVATLAVVGLHGTVDYVWHIPTVMLVCGLMLGRSIAVPEGSVPRSAPGLARRRDPGFTACRRG